MKKTKNIVLTGGHAATTALATIEELKSVAHFKNYSLHWIGATSAIEGNKVATIEEKVFPDLGVKVHAITAGKLQRKFSKNTIPSFLKIPVGFWQSYWLLRKINPEVVISFGGNVGLSVSIGAWLLGIPLIVHEQTVAGGLANRLSAKLAAKVALAREQSKALFPSDKSVIVGNPVIREIASLPAKTKKGERPTIFVMGGSRGSQVINKAVANALAALVKNFTVIHQTGALDFPQSKPSENYEVYATISPLEIAKFYKRSDIIVGRSGANTVSEVLLLNRPAIFIPIPWVQFDEQRKNALVAKQAGIATIIEQDKLTPKLLVDTIASINKDWNNIVKNAHPLSSIPNDRDAASKLVSLIYDLLPPQ